MKTGANRLDRYRHWTSGTAILLAPNEVLKRRRKRTVNRGQHTVETESQCQTTRLSEGFRGQQSEHTVEMETESEENLTPK